MTAALVRSAESKPGSRRRPVEQAEVQAAYRASVASGRPLTGAELGRRFGRTDRWGRMQLAKLRDEEANRNGSRPTRATRASGEAGGSRDTAAEIREATLARRAALAARTGGTPAASGRPVQGAGHVPGTRSLGRQAVRWLTTLTVLGVAMAAARASYDHQRLLVEQAGESDSAWYLPLSLDGMMLVASLTMLIRRWDGEPAGWLTWTALLLGGTASLFANIAAAEPTLIGRIVAAWPPVCLLVSFELLLQQLRADRAPHDGTTDTNDDANR